MNPIKKQKIKCCVCGKLAIMFRGAKAYCKKHAPYYRTSKKKRRGR